VTLIVINLAMTFAIPGISWQGHIGGLVTGGLIAAVYMYAPRAQRTLIHVGATIGLLAVFVALIAWRTTSLVAQYGPMLTHR
jgi:CDP-diglyceride synthetase